MSTKVCSSCGGEKDLGEFRVNRTEFSLVGKLNKCNGCVEIERIDYGRTLPGVISNAFKDERQRRETRGESNPYKLEVFQKRWQADATFNELFVNWVVSGYTKSLRPVWYVSRASERWVFSKLVAMTLGERSKIYTEERNVVKKQTASQVYQRLVRVNPETNEVIATYSGIGGAEAAFIPRSIIERSLANNDGVWGYRNIHVA